MKMAKTKFLITAKLSMVTVPCCLGTSLTSPDKVTNRNTLEPQLHARSVLCDSCGMQHAREATKYKALF